MNIVLSKMKPVGCNDNPVDINYIIEELKSGSVLIASCRQGICLLRYVDDDSKDSIEKELKRVFGNCVLKNVRDEFHREAVERINSKKWNPEPLPLCVKGTEFQFKVWEAISRIPEGKCASYREIAAAAGYPTALRAVGSAVGANPVAIIIPCHRVITASGRIGNYRWGVERKIKLLEEENIIFSF